MGRGKLFRPVNNHVVFELACIIRSALLNPLCKKRRESGSIFLVSLVKLRGNGFKTVSLYIANMFPYHYTVARITIFYFWMINVLVQELKNVQKTFSFRWEVGFRLWIWIESVRIFFAKRKQVYRNMKG